MSQQALANAADITQNGVFRLEAGETNPQLLTLQRIASALECSVRDLVCGSSESTPVLADRLRRVKRVLDSKDPAAISVMDSGIGAAEALLERVVRKLRQPPLGRIVKGQGRRSPVDDLLLMKGQVRRRSEADENTIADAVRKAHKPFRSSGTTHETGGRNKK